MSTSGASGAGGAGSDEARDDLMATLAAARELHPEMDTALADQYLARRQEQQQRAAQQPVQSPVVARRGRPAIPVALLVLGAVIVTAAASSQSWWLLFLLIPLMSGGFGFRRSWEYSSTGEDDPRYQRRMARLRYHQERLAARHGYQLSRPDVGDSPSRQPRSADQAAAATLPGAATPAIPASVPASVPAPRPQSPAGQFTGGTPPPGNPAG